MRAEHGRRRTDDRELARRAETVAPPRPTARDEVLALQRSAGNAAVARLLRSPKEPREGGWNEKGRAVTGTQRIPVKGLKQGNKAKDPQGFTDESAAGRAVVIVPDGVDLDKEVDVLLHFHGWWAGGLRERKEKDVQGPAGTVHDVEDDRLPQQLASKGRNIVGVLPQGTNKSGFGNIDPQSYVTDALALAAADLPSLLPKLKSPVKITPGRIIVSGHSGGGVAATAAAATLTAKAPADDAAWVRATPMFLFDAINGTAELKAVADLARQWLEADLVRLNASSDPDKLLNRRGIKLRSTHSADYGPYKVLNVGGGSYTTNSGDVVTRTKKQSLRGQIDTWFTDRAGAFGASTAAVQTKWREQYEVPEKETGGKHEYTLGTGKTAEEEGKARLPSPAGLTGPSKKAGVPGYSAGGNLDEALSKLPVLEPPPPPPKHTELEDTPDPQGADTAYA
jgi:pimeloyl-ACP methyl ester carboxylesterase